MYIIQLIRCGDIAFKVATFISNRVFEFKSKPVPDRHVNVYRKKVISHMHHRVEIFGVVPLDVADNEI